MTTPERWARIERLYHEALALGTNERGSFLADACAGDDALRREVESLLAHDGGAAFLSTPAVPSGGPGAGSSFIGRHLGPYVIQSALGAGGMGEVYRARDTKLARDVAIKILPRPYTSDPNRLARFEREARMLAALNHPHIGAIYGLEDIDGGAALVLELVEGETLAELIAGSGIQATGPEAGRSNPGATGRPVAQSLEIARQIAEALEAAHEKGIVHRDLKPTNIKVTPLGVVKVLDFGLAKAEGDASEPHLTQSQTITKDGTREGVILGTPAYMAPEQARGQAADARSDIWAFGVILYEMLTGKRGFDGETTTEVLGNVLTADLDWAALPPLTPPVIRSLLQRCVQKDRSRRLRAIADARFQIEETINKPTALAARLLDPRRHNLPAELTSFVGRRKELLELPRVLASSRLLSLTGAGGVGKTRLAVRLARDLVNEFRDGVWLVDLAPLSLPDLVAQTIATALGIQEGAQRSARDVLLDTVRDRELLLVIDTCEHLITTCAELVEALLREAPALRIIATSREALGVSGEAICRVPSLSLPQALTSVSVDALVDSEATQLFVERASAVDPAFTPTSDNADVISRLCQRLDGIPLAIELAAARIAVLSPEQIEARLQDRFHLLTGGTRTAVARQRTLEATIDWSYHLLSDVERQLLSRLSVFPATWTLEAAEHVCGDDGINKRDVLDLLSRLVTKSLVVVDCEFAGERRYRLLETVRQYGRERQLQAGAADRLRARHFDFFFNEFRGALPILRHHNQLACLRQLRIEQENVRAALEWGLMSAAPAEKGVELAGALFWFWTKRGLYEEGRLWLERAIAVAADVPRALRARALIGLAHMHHFQGHPFEAVIAEALSLGRESDDAWVVSFALFMQGLAALEGGDSARAAALCLQARDAADVSGELVQHGGPLLVLAIIAVLSGDYDRAQQLYRESIDVHRREGEIWGLSILLSGAAGLCIIRQDFDQARAQASEALSLCQELEDPRGLAWSLDVFAGLLAAEGHADGAARLWGFSDRLLESVGGSLRPETRWIRNRYIEPVRTSLGAESFETARTEGRAMLLVRAVALARQQAVPA